MQTMVVLARDGSRAQIAQEGRKLLADPRTIGQGIRLIQDLSRGGRHREAVDLARVLYEQRRKSRDLNVLMSAVLAEGATDEIRAVACLAAHHQADPRFDYDVQFLATWLRVLHEMDDQPQFWMVFDSVCSHEDKVGNLYVVGQYFRMLIRVGRYRDVLSHWETLDASTRSDGFILKHKARALIELGRLGEAERTLADTRDDHLKRSLVARLEDIKKRFGIRDDATSRAGTGVLESWLSASRESHLYVDRPDRSRAKLTETPECFEGRVYIQPLVATECSREVEVLAVFFENGARTLPHTHESDQVLWVLEGTCAFAHDSGRREVSAGACVLLPAQQWCWHGAARDQSACHVSVRKPGKTDWTVPRRDW